MLFYFNINITAMYYKYIVVFLLLIINSQSDA